MIGDLVNSAQHQAVKQELCPLMPFKDKCTYRLQQIDGGTGACA
jgi:hypothetical protein